MNSSFNKPLKKINITTIYVTFINCFYFLSKIMTMINSIEPHLDKFVLEVWGPGLMYIIIKM